MTDVASTVDQLVRPMAEEAGVDLLEVDVRGTGARTRIRVVVDRKGGVDLATCRSIAKSLSRAMDLEDPVKDRYTLEVTSPGTDRPLTDQRSFDRIEGRLVRIVCRAVEGGAVGGAGAEGVEAPIEVRGTVTAAGEDAVVLTDADGTDHAVRYELIEKATQELPW